MHLWRLILVFGLMASGAVAQELSIKDKDSTAAIAVPTGWRLQPMSGVKNDIAVGPSHGDFAVNIILTSEFSPLSFEDYRTNNRALLALMYKGFKVLSEEEMKSASGVPMVRLVASSEVGTGRLRQTFFYGPGAADMYFLVICAAPLEEAGAYEQTFDEVAQSVAVTAPPPSPPKDGAGPTTATVETTATPSPEVSVTEAESSATKKSPSSPPAAP